MEQLIGKTIKSIEEPRYMKITSDNYDSTTYDDNLLITFTYGTVLKLASWNDEGYLSGMYKQIIPPTTTN